MCRGLGVFRACAVGAMGSGFTKLRVLCSGIEAFWFEASGVWGLTSWSFRAIQDLGFRLQVTCCDPAVMEETRESAEMRQMSVVGLHAFAGSSRFRMSYGQYPGLSVEPQIQEGHRVPDSNLGSPMVPFALVVPLGDPMPEDSGIDGQKTPPNPWDFP